MLGLLVPLVVFGVLGGYAWTWYGRGLRSWGAVGERLGLQLYEESFWGGWELSGEIRGCRVRVVNPSGKRRGGHRTTRLSVEGLRPISPRIELRSESLLTSARKLIAGEDVIIGDPEFDQRVHVQGPVEVLFAILDARSRASVRRFVTSGPGEVSAGSVNYEARSLIVDPEALEKIILDMVRIAESVQRPEDGYLERLQRNLEADPLPEVRRRCLQLLVDRPGPATVQAVATGLADPDDGVRLAAALAAGPSGVDALEALLARRTLAPGAAIAALEGLAHASPERAAIVVPELLAAAPSAITPIAVALVARLALRGCLARLGTLARHPDPAVGEAIAAALEALDEGREILLGQLAHPAPAVRARAALSLGALGQLEHVRPLMELSAGPKVVREAALGAIRRIQARHARAGAGTLALAREGAGGLALGVAAGRLSSTEEAP